MKISLRSVSAAAALLLTTGLFCQAHAQDYVLESHVLLFGHVYTQGPARTLPSPFGRRTRERTSTIISTPFNNNSILATMTGLGLISGNGWELLYLEDSTGTGGIYASNGSATPVAVPTDLLTLPVFGPSLTRGTEITGTGGSSYDGETEIATATATVDSIPVSGLATNGNRTLTLVVSGSSVQFNTVFTTMPFQGGVSGTNGNTLADGIITVGTASVSPLTALPK